MIVFHKTYKDRDFHIFLENVALHLQKHFGATLVEPLTSETGDYITIENYDVNILDCELAIYYQDTNVLKVLSFSDIQSRLCSYMMGRNKETDLLLHSQQSCTDLWVKDLKLEIADGSLSIFDGQSILHGVSPFVKTSADAYRYTVVYYTLEQMWKCETITDELIRIRKKKKEREFNRLDENHLKSLQKRKQELATASDKEYIAHYKNSEGIVKNG